MKCFNPKCEAGYESIIVIETRVTLNYVRRRRKCTICGHRFTTVEMAAELFTGRSVNKRPEYVLIEKADYNRMRVSVLRHLAYMNKIAEDLNLKELQ